VATVHGETGAQIADSLRAKILGGEYQPGQRILQARLAEEHGTSRLPVREALRLLEAEGLVTLTANTGAWVSRLSYDECQELYQVRERIDPLLLRMSLPLLGEDAVAELDDLATRMENSADVEEFLRLDREFHLLPTRAVPTTFLGDIVLDLWNRTQHYRRAVTRLFYDDGDRTIHHEHRLIVTAVRDRDPDAAEALMAGHVRRTRLELKRHPEVFGS
jgi:DNA-binding GntR family transcriptional regulator